MGRSVGTPSDGVFVSMLFPLRHLIQRNLCRAWPEFPKNHFQGPLDWDFRSCAF
jgi:hypothetical protein